MKLEVPYDLTSEPDTLLIRNFIIVYKKLQLKLIKPSKWH